MIFLRTAGHIALGCWLGMSMVLPVQAAPPPTLRSFGEWCEQRHQHSVDTEMTIAALLRAIGTEDCQEAQVRLSEITVVYPIAPETTAIAHHELVVDLRMLVDLEPLVAAMPELRYLELPSAIVSDLTPLRHLPHLESLILPEANIDDIRPLAMLPNLAQLDLRGNLIRDLSPLGGLQELVYLDVRDNQIQDFRVLSKLPHLFSVRLGGNPIDTSTCLGKWADACEL
jgi:internalin A